MKRLTARQIAVIQAMADGATSMANIGDRLHISTHTVRTHIKHIYQRLHVGTWGAAVAFGFRTGLIR